MEYDEMVKSRDNISLQIQTMERERREKIFERSDYSLNTSEELKVRRLQHRKEDLVLLNEQLQHGNYYSSLLQI